MLIKLLKVMAVIRVTPDYHTNKEVKRMLEKDIELIGNMIENCGIIFLSSKLLIFI